MADRYPEWSYFPQSVRPPTWVDDVVTLFATHQEQIDSGKVDGLTSDRVLAILRPGLLALGFVVEAGKTKADRIRRPVLFGERGSERVAYEVDAVNDEHGILMEIEAGRGARGNAIYRDLVRSSLVVAAKFLVLGVMRQYRHKSGGRPVSVNSYRDARDLLDAIYASGRLQLPFEGILILGY